MIDINEIRKRADDATPGPWSVEGESYNEDCEPVPMPHNLAGPDGTIWSSGSGEYSHPDMATAVFIASARTDVPALCDRVEALEKEFRFVVDNCSDVNNSIVREIVAHARAALEGR